MKNPSDQEELRRKILGLGDTSLRKTHYPSLRQRLAELERFRSLVDISSDLLFVVEYPSGQIMDVSAASCEHLGFERHSLLARSFADLVPTATWAATLDLLTQVRNGNKRNAVIRTEIENPESHQKVPVEIAVQSLKIGDSYLAILAARDITERKQAERRILQLNHLYAVVTEVNKAIVKATERDALFREICRLCIDCGHFKTAWIAQYDRQTGFLPPIAWAGDDLLVQPGGCSTQGNACAQAIANGCHFVCNDLEHDPIARQLEVAPRGYRSACLVPLQFPANEIGALALYSSESRFFDEEELGLLDGVASDISFALDALERDEKRRRAEQIHRETHRKVEAILEASPIAIVALDLQGKVTAWNQAAEQIFGWPQHEVIGSPNPVDPREHEAGARGNPG